MTPIQQLYKYFSDLMKPTGAQFRALIDSFWHKAEKIPISSIEGLDKLIEGTASARQLQNHINDTHAHKELLDKKVDKVPGKKLTTEDFTTELRHKLEGLRQVDISLLLPRGNFTGTAQDLKDLIDGLTRILQSPDTELDELREIVAYIKQNKHILSTLGINNIAGLEEALANKADKNHNHDERYAPITHHHNGYAHRTHRHNKDDIDGLPANIATTESIKTAIEGIQVGGRNLILNSRFYVLNFVSWVSGTVTEENDSIFGKVAKIERPNGVGDFQYNFNTTLSNRVYFNNKDLIYLIIAKPLTDNASFNFGFWQESYDSLSVVNKVPTKNTREVELGDGWKMYWVKINKPNVGVGTLGLNSVSGSWLLYACGIFESSVPVNWTPAIEDMTLVTRPGVECTQNMTLQRDHQNQTIFVTVSCNIELNTIDDLSSVSFRKVFDNGTVSFSCTGKNIIYTSDNQFNGKKGSTAVISRYGNDCYIDIRNV